MDADDKNEEIASVSEFKKKYAKVLEELDVLYRGAFDSDEGMQIGALCLLAQAPLIKIQATAELKAKSLKRDIDFAKAEAYARIKDDAASKKDGKKLTEAALLQLVNKDEEVHRLYMEQNVAEKEAKELANILLLLRDAHITFRSIAKKEI